MSVPRTGELPPGEGGASPIFPSGKALTGSWSRTPSGQGCAQAPWDTNRATEPQGECTELPEGLQHVHALTREQLRGSRAVALWRGCCRAEKQLGEAQVVALCREDCTVLGAAQRCSGSRRGSLWGGGCVALGAAQRFLGSGSMEEASPPEVRIQQHRPRSTGRLNTAQDPDSPRDRQRPGGHRTAKTLLLRAEQISGPAPRVTRPCRLRTL